jgi:hypothetical protein
MYISIYSASYFSHYIFTFFHAHCHCALSAIIDYGFQIFTISFICIPLAFAAVSSLSFFAAITPRRCLPSQLLLFDSQPISRRFLPLQFILLPFIRAISTLFHHDIFAMPLLFHSMLIDYRFAFFDASIRFQFLCCLCLYRH